jgi:hypothetical protein
MSQCFYVHAHEFVRLVGSIKLYGHDGGGRAKVRLKLYDRTEVHVSYYEGICVSEAFLVLGRKVLGCHIGCYMGCHIRCSDTNKKNKLQNPLVNRETNLLSLTNPSLAHCTVALYC